MNELASIIPKGSAVSLGKNRVRVLGIDLGTTNSAAAEIEWPSEKGVQARATCLDIKQKTLEGTDENNITVPSVVAIFKGKEYVGEGAKRLRVRAKEFGLIPNRNIFYECKNDIGLKKTYNLAPSGYRSAADIGAKVLRFLSACRSTLWKRNSEVKDMHGPKYSPKWSV